jgi:hypothetical protein
MEGEMARDDVTRPFTLLLLGIATLLPAALPPALDAQQATTPLVGSVHDSTDKAIPGVEIRINGGAFVARTNDAGGFRFAGVPVGRADVLIRRMGFAPTMSSVVLREGRIDSLAVHLAVVAAALPGLRVEDEADARSHRLLAGFWERRSQGFGNFMTRDQIEARNASNFVDLVRQVPSASIVSVNGRSVIRFKRAIGPRDCPPQYWIDGMRLEQASPDEFTPGDLEGIEIYAGPSTIPVQFAPRPTTYTCGAIILWTRVPGN